MSDLAATNCGGCGDCNGFGGSSCYWIIILLFLCSSCGNGLNNNGGCGCGDNSCLWIILLLFFCGGCGNNGSFNNGGCGCGC